MTKQKTEPVKNNGVVSVKLKETEKTELALQAEKEGISFSELLRKKISGGSNLDVKETENLPGIGKQMLVKEDASISAESLLNIAIIVEEVVKAAKAAAPEREYLKKLSQQAVDSSITLSFEEEAFLKLLSDSIKAEVRENLLLEENCVPIASIFKNEMQSRTFKEMTVTRNKVSSEKIPVMQTLLVNSMKEGFFQSCETLYNNRLFKAVYGFSYEEFEKIFSED